MKQTLGRHKRPKDSLIRIRNWFLGAMSLLAVCPAVTLGQESLPESRAINEKVSTTQIETDVPTEKPNTVTKKRRFPVGPQPVTPEQREEAERLRELNAKYGTDPTAIVGRVQLSSQYRNLPRSASSILTVARVDLPFRGDYVFRVEAPFLQSSIPGPTGTTTAHGFSDLGVILGWRAYNTPEYAVLIGVNASFPTATEDKVGLGKYTLGPIIATARFLPKFNSFLIGVLSQQISVGGDSDRKSINISNASLRINTIWAEKWWSVARAGWLLNWEQSTRGSMDLDLEIGRNVVGKWGIFIRPGIGIFGKDLPGNYSWKIAGGIRYIYPSF